MTAPEDNPQSGPSNAALEDKCRELSRLVNVLLAGLVITSFTLTAYLGLEAKRASAAATDAKTRADALIKVVQQDDANINAFFSRLLEFAHTHPDFQNRVLYKYKLNNPPK